MARRNSGRKTTLPPLNPSELPPLARRMARTGRVAVMAHDWVDPDDIRPTAARVARRVHGMRAYDPIMVMAADPRSGVEPRHVHAANKIREMVDAARLLGFGGGGWLEAFGGAAPGPRMGMKMSQRECARACLRLQRLYPRLTVSQWRRLVFIVLENETISAWVRKLEDETGRRADRQFEKGQLIGSLDVIHQYFETEIDEEIDAGRRLPV
jgi:hypothetical protein